MAKATICDKCGATLRYASDCHIKLYIHPYGDQHYELCEKCTEELKQWLYRKYDTKPI